MQLSTRGRYAVMAMTDLASRQSDGCECGPVCLAEIAGRQQLSLAYLEQLFGKLRRAGLVASARGPGGGYRLARTPNEIAIADIVAAVDEPIRATRCEEGSGGCMAIPASGSAGATGNETGGEPGGGSGGGSGGGRCQTHDLWYELGLQIELFLKGVSLADVVARRIRGRAVSIARQPDLSLAAD
jgi:Rrf2 family transcriptional regulator, iron-sulfur cluster assembly transcription factor